MGRIIVLLFIAFNLHATDTNEEKLFLYLHHKAHLKDKNEPHHKIESHLNAFKRVFSKGRIDIYELKKGMNFPLEMTDLLRPIKKGDWKVIPPELLTEKLNSEPEIIELIKKLDTSRVRYHLEYASGQASRRSGAPGNQELTAYILDYLKKLNYEMKKDCFSPGLCNVFGYKKGEIDEYVLIEAHLDSVGKSYAGADDNASGVAGLLEMAKILSDLKTKRGLIIFATNGEESGLLGAKDFVAKSKRSGFLSKLK